MENFEYNRVFPFESDEANDVDPDEAETIKDFLPSYERTRGDSPRFLFPFAARIFEKTVIACKRIEKEFSGKIKAKITYSSFNVTHRALVLLC